MISNLDVPGTIAAAYLIWGAYEEESDPSFVFNGHAVNGTEYREALDAVAYVANVSSYVSTGTHSYTVENSSPYTMLGASLYVVYASEDVDASLVTWLGGVDTAYWNRPYFPKGPDTEVYSYSFAPVDYDRQATLTLSVGGGDHTNPNRGDALWVKSATGAVPTNLVDQAGATELLHNLLTSHEGPEWDHPTVTVTIPANATYFAYQIESPEDDNGESFILFASSLTAPLDCPTGDLTVNKKVDENGDGIFEGGNVRANELGFQWSDITETKMRDMGTPNETGVGPHQITETQLPGWHFVGWYDDKNISDYSCTNPQGTTLPVPVEVFEDQETSITLCNARDFTTIDFDKVVVGGGPSTDQDWTFHVEGLGDFTEASAPVSVPTMTQYMVTETSGSYDNLYTLTNASGICSYANGVITLDTGRQGGTCVLENTRNTGEITGVKYYDHNANGVRDDGDE
ncbi:hypothetical protein KC906_01110, partial [Candidatus Kaiserbacteria bacterium]|nr:hypothetical protein [Candidatus Kaiserbacteria bacterium]